MHLPSVKSYSIVDEFRELAVKSLDTVEKRIYYCGSVENLAAVFDQEFDRGFISPPAPRGHCPSRCSFPIGQFL